MPNILLIDDSSMTRRVLSHTLKKGGHVVVLAESARQALDYLAGAVVDLAIIDLHMPEMDGFAATRAIRQIELLGGRYIPIIAMTASVVDGGRDKCIAAGMDDYISKPAQLACLNETIQRWMDAPVDSS